jgi:hypothetical protein
VFSLHRPPAKGNLGPVALRTEQPDPPIIPPSRRPLSEVLADPSYSNGAKLLAAHLDGRCLSPGKWAAWPKVSTVAAALGWGNNPRAFRKRFERAARELIEGGDLARPRVGELVDWYDAVGGPQGLDWPKGLRRGLARSAAVCVLGWKLAEIEERLPSLTACDIPVASSGPSSVDPAPLNVASDTPGMSHPTPPEMSHPTRNVRSPNVRIEPTLNVPNDNGSAFASGEGDGEPPAEAIEQAREFVLRLRRRGMYLDLGTGPDGAEGIRPRHGESVKPLQPDEIDELKRLRPHILAYLKGPVGPTPGPAGGQGDARGKPAPAVPGPVQAEVRKLIVQLPGNPDPEIEARVCRAISEALSDRKPKSLAMFLGQAGHVRRGGLAVGCLLDAFEAGCSLGARHRGKMYTTGMKASKAKSRSVKPAGGSP